MRNLNIIIITTILLGYTTQVNSQILLQVGDTVNLSVTGIVAGTIQWQQSDDSLVWVDISGAVNNPQTLLATASATEKRYYMAKVTDPLCPPATPVFSSPIQHRVKTLVQIGDYYEGGIVFWIDGTGHGLIAPQQDQSTGVQWGCFGTSIPGATSLTDGNENTTAIYNNCATRPIAASICYDLVFNGYSDWFLPAKDQLNYLYQQRALVGGFTTGTYWSSSESTTNFACKQFFSDGIQAYGSKSNFNYVRCVQSFLSEGIFNFTASVTDQPETVSISTEPQMQNLCFGSSVTFSVTAIGTAPVSYKWKKDGVDISGATSNTYTKSGLTLVDEGIYSCEVTNLCRTVASNNAELKVIQLSADAVPDIRICDDQNAQLLVSVNTNHPAESGIYSYTWSPAMGLSDANIYNPETTITVTTDYSVNITDEVGCTASDTVNVLVQNVFQNEEICLVSVDTIAWKNKVMWEGTTDVGTEKHWIYKEVVTNIYNWIGEVTYGSPTFFIDNASNPESHSDRYKITVIDTCNGESARSAYHNTMNLVVSVFGSTMGLVWTEYETEDGSYTPDQYYIYKGPTPQDMTLLTTVTGSQNTYNDVNVFDLQYYMIGAQRDCNVYPTYSNKRDNGLVEVNATSLTGTILISPNPMTTSATLEIPNFKSEIRSTKSEIRILDITGKVVRTLPLTPSCHPEQSEGSPHARITIERGDLKPGIYFVELKADRIYRGKLVVE